ncbi:uncharacterized protein TEOVI_000909400 [Trypanosoma equiperdum]|uniref:Trypanosome variant surface glycoprotein (A-type) n=1 Tax=Trypanosoma equiperdum TaxID=5694 RepID=A0A1G4I6V1_TRYEQ|nr:hypothetical protein TEOVI_000909400 [Trypanosoma equiperdum]
MPLSNKGHRFKAQFYWAMVLTLVTLTNRITQKSAAETEENKQQTPCKSAHYLWQLAKQLTDADRPLKDQQNVLLKQKSQLSLLSALSEDATARDALGLLATLASAKAERTANKLQLCKQATGTAALMLAQKAGRAMELSEVESIKTTARPEETIATPAAGTLTLPTVVFEDFETNSCEKKSSRPRTSPNKPRHKQANQTQNAQTQARNGDASRQVLHAEMG